MRRNTLIVTIVTGFIMAGAGLAFAGEIHGCFDGKHGGHWWGKEGVHGPSHPFMPHLGHMAEELGLTEEQRAEIREILKEEMPAIHDHIKSKISTVLTPEQREQLETIHEQHRNRELHGPGGHMVHMLKGLVEHLDLTEEQRAEIHDLISESTPENRHELRTKIRDVLTPEQQEKMQALREEHWSKRKEMRTKHGDRGMRGHGGPMMRMMGHLADRLELTEEQRAEIRELLMVEMPSIKDQIMEKISTVLTPEQQEKLNEIREEHWSKIKEHLEEVFE